MTAAVSTHKPVRGSATYVWFTGEKLGHGAMGNVYLARDRRRGTKFAAKVYNRDMKSTQKSYIQRELDIFQNIPKHDYIVQMVAIEKEKYSQEPVVFMELCEGGSLQHILDTPRCFYGLPEEEFLLVLEHTYKALAFLRSQNIVHRDVKPGNILCYQTLDGRNIYKLTDFGAAIVLESPDSNFKTLCGTEEYLHPDLHYSAFQRRVPDRVYGLGVDVWSFAVTMYQCATGQLPFRPLLGVRSDRKKMHELMTVKGRGVISQVEQQDGSIEPFTRLPQTCRLSSSTKQHFTSLVADIFNLKDHPTPCQIFTEFHSFFQLEHLRVFSLESRELLTVCVHRKDSMEDVESAVLKATSTSLLQPKMYIQGQRLHSVCTSYRDSAHPIDIFSSETIIVVGSANGCISYNDYFPPNPRITSDASMKEDVKWAKEMCGILHYLCAVVDDCVNVQTCLGEAIKAVLNEIMESSEKVGSQINSLVKMEGMLVSPCRDISSHPTSCDMNPTPNGRSLLSPSSHLVQQHQIIAKNINQHLTLRNNHTRPPCIQKRCSKTAILLMEKGDELYKQIGRVTKADLSHNDAELHRFNKSEMKHSLKRADRLIKDCISTTNELFVSTEGAIRDMESTACDIGDLSDKYHVYLDMLKTVQAPRTKCPALTADSAKAPDSNTDYVPQSGNPRPHHCTPVNNEDVSVKSDTSVFAMPKSPDAMSSRDFQPNEGKSDQLEMSKQLGTLSVKLEEMKTQAKHNHQILEKLNS